MIPSNDSQWRSLSSWKYFKTQVLPFIHHWPLLYSVSCSWCNSQYWPFSHIVCSVCDLASFIFKVGPLGANVLPDGFVKYDWHIVHYYKSTKNLEIFTCLRQSVRLFIQLFCFLPYVGCLLLNKVFHLEY